ncbi:Eukaryotic aspartyl protease family protein [Raphanus sativus]|uniref:Probable aspartic proteinase GIP2 n=1 Tax=Raphanus sativus TaxID=3726 RepID=A0A6J0MLZ1_RAPSA|nr:probable aspartic proteinase GIP2 [Raphanus sativus]KAJ4873395.1 Eukaryotic aspartyl protease family protein [Raphanus sativus]
MDSSCLNIFVFSFLSVLFITKSQIYDSVNGVVFPVTRDLSTGQYVAEIRLGDSLEPVKLVVDLSGPLLWFDCSSGHISSSRSLVSGSSSGCLKAKAGNDRVSSRGDHNTECDLLVRNGVVGITARGELATDVLSLGSVSSQGTVDLLFACAPPLLLRGLASGGKGVMGLSKAQISLPSQLAAETNERLRLTVYLSPSNGVVSTNSVEDLFGTAASSSLVYTPLSTSTSGDYVINVKSIRVNGKKLSLEGPLSAELSTVVPYTTLESSIYELFAEAYVKAATNAKSVAPVAPFGLCFTSTSSAEVEFPAVELALQSEMVRWRIQGKNLLVDAGGGVQCLGVVNGGSNSNRVSPIIMGGLQLEGFVLDFDLGNSAMGFGERTRSSSDSFRQEAF